MEPYGETAMRCPACGAYDIRPSMPRGPVDAFFLYFGKKPLRCRRCNCRFHRVVEEKARTEGTGDDRAPAP